MMALLPRSSYSNLANNLFASSCDSRRPIISFATFHLRSSSWPSVNVPSSSLARASDHPLAVISPPPSFPLFIVGRILIKRCDKEQKQDGEELRKKDHDGYPSRECCCC